MKEATSMGLFENLAQFDYNNQIVDLHNDYDCQDLCFANGELQLRFVSCANDRPLLLSFADVTLDSFTFFIAGSDDHLTIDTLYRGRCEINGELMEISSDGRAYFYLEFYTGQKMEFWARSISLAIV